MKIGATPDYKNRRLFVQTIKDKVDASHEHYIDEIKIWMLVKEKMASKVDTIFT